MPCEQSWFHTVLLLCHMKSAAGIGMESFPSPSRSTYGIHRWITPSRKSHRERRAAGINPQTFVINSWVRIQLKCLKFMMSKIYTIFLMSC